jgi:hypothetical protein
MYEVAKTDGTVEINLQLFLASTLDTVNFVLWPLYLRVKNVYYVYDRRVRVSTLSSPEPALYWLLLIMKMKLSMAAVTKLVLAVIYL